jgi:ankyrin repeat protein
MNELRLVIELLLRRGADPNISLIPMPPLFFAVKAANVNVVQILLSKKADVNFKLSDKVSFV